ncbi:MAG: alkaline phosphatase family protein [Thermodesulfobacteriota bacterium]|nr:alkaline phosphatase family protein [Thermodesulfobacteriota bacterium]
MMAHQQATTMVIGLDGATYSILYPLMEAGHMPYLSRFVAEGARAELASTIPPITPPAWTTIMTGRSPSSHGILDFFRPESPGSRFLRFVSTKQLKCETVWSLMTRNGRSSVCLNFPVMSPPIPISGYSIPGFVTWRHLRHSCHPGDLMDTLKTIPGFDLKIIAHDFGLEEKVVAGCSREESEEWIKYHTYKDDQWVKVMTYLAGQDPCHLNAMVLDSIDRLQHVFYRLLDPECYKDGLSEEDRHIQSMLHAHYRELDAMIERMAGAAGPDGTVFIVSDHGFGPSEHCFYLNSLLEKRGYLTWSDRAVTETEGGGDVSMDAVKNHGHLLDWERTTAFVNTPSSNGITINVRGKNSKTGIAPEDYDRVVNRLRDELLAVNHPTTGEPVVKQIWTREEAFAGTDSEMAPDLTLRLWDNGLVSTVKSDKIIKARKECIGVHYPMGVFMARGPGIKAGARLDPLNILDVAPAMLYSQGLPIPEDYEGRVPEEMMTPEALAANPVVIGDASSQADHLGDDAPEMDEEDMELIMKRMKGLGYIS